ncbi:helix-turn-helix domain-containing protein [Cohnella sp. GCM10027633]|uniref:AraC family transcriptional regulator n=1 Tax=unclassified Cohnella TaxID=2636738 RepID=UPI0036347149
MKPIRKPFNVSPAFPFSFVYRDTKTKQRELPDHLHDWYEIVYVHSGQGAFFIDRTFYDMRAGDLFLIPGNTIHRAFPDAADPVTSTAAFFSPLLVPQPAFGEPFSLLRCFDRSRQTRSFQVKCSPALQETMEDGLRELDRELRDSEPGVRHAVSLHLQRLLLAVGRETGAGVGPTSQAPAIGPVWMRDTLLYIDANYTEDIGLRELCKRAAVSPAHFSRVFKELTGMNVTAFIAAKRIIRAKELLLETDRNVAAIASDCGFENVPHFHRLFKRIAGKTPAAYRRGLDE